VAKVYKGSKTYPNTYPQANRAKVGAAAAPLSAKQRSIQFAAAHRAYHVQMEGMDADEQITFMDWSCQEVCRAVGKRGLSDCNQGDYAVLMAHWCGLQGDTQQQDYWMDRASTNERRQAKAALEVEMLKASDVIEETDTYVTVICWDRFKCEPRDATAKQLWALTIDIRRAAQKRRKSVVGSRKSEVGSQRTEVGGQQVFGWDLAEQHEEGVTA
jgi:hypothetical protein